jgi:hypothetical protein
MHTTKSSIYPDHFKRLPRRPTDNTLQSYHIAMRAPLGPSSHVIAVLLLLLTLQAHVSNSSLYQCQCHACYAVFVDPHPCVTFDAYCQSISSDIGGISQTSECLYSGYSASCIVTSSVPCDDAYTYGSDTYLLDQSCVNYCSQFLCNYYSRACTNSTFTTTTATPWTIPQYPTLPAPTYTTSVKSLSATSVTFIVIACVSVGIVLVCCLVVLVKNVIINHRLMRQRRVLPLGGPHPPAYRPHARTQEHVVIPRNADLPMYAWHELEATPRSPIPGITLGLDVLPGEPPPEYDDASTAPCAMTLEPLPRSVELTSSNQICDPPEYTTTSTYCESTI